MGIDSEIVREGG